MRRAGVEVGCVSSLEQMLFAFEYQAHMPGEDVQPFLAVMLVEFFVVSVRGDLDRDCLQIGQRAAAGNRPIAETVCRSPRRASGTDNAASRGLLIAGIEQGANRDVVNLAERDQRGERGLPGPSLQPGEIW